VSTQAAIAYGALGGFVAWIVVFALPELRSLREVFRDPDAPNPRLREYIVAAGIAVCLVALGCVGPFLFGDPTGAREAIAYGVAAEALLGGIIKGTVGN
jgi:hypothetical protein